MSKADERPTQYRGLSWMLVSLVAVIIISFVLPFPKSFVVSLIVIFCIIIIRANMMLRKSGMLGLKGWSDSYSSFKSGRGWDTGDTYKPLTFYCMLCGYPHNKIACPKCGSKAVRVR
jgi:hypothetical protein